MAQVLVTGANGFLGSSLLRALKKEGHELFILLRQSSDTSEISDISYTPIYGDITQKNTLDFSKIDYVFHLAGLVAYKKSDRAKMELINVQGTQNVVDTCLEHNVKRLIHMSSVTAIGAGFQKNQILNEDSKYNIAHLDLGYFETKKAAEDIVIEAVKNRGLDAVILNPSTIYGPADAKKGSRKNQVQVAQGKLKFYTSGGVSVVSVEDVVQATLAACKKGRKGERYILSGDNLLIKDLFAMIAKHAGVPAPSILLPDFVLHAVGASGDFLAHFGLKSPLSRENAWTATMYHWFDNAKAKRELDFNPKPADYAIEQSVQWMKHAKLLA